ncbi:MAG: hypothetical protein Q8L76_16470, partial [Cypionkella sp.]|nr:hypothetical protein [Cypionkella sp.]
MKPLTTHEEFCLKNAAHFVAARGRTPRDRTRQQFATDTFIAGSSGLPELQAPGDVFASGGALVTKGRVGG